MSDRETVRRTVECKNPQCGSTCFEKGYAFEADADNPKPVWRCQNCGWETPRISRRRDSNHIRAIKGYLAIRAEWETTDAALDSLATAGAIKGGALLVHSR